MKKALSIVLCLVMLLGSVAIGGDGLAEVMEAFTLKASATTIDSYSQGDIIEFGWYPQTKETDSSIISALNSSADIWYSYEYYSGKARSWYDGEMFSSDYMRYTDVMYNGNKYRGVTFDSYRPFVTGYALSLNSTNQKGNGYNPNNIYWFKYEPIKWRVLDPSAGMVMSEMILDSQAYNNYILKSGTDENGKDAFWGDAEKTYLANNYENSSIREWLNNEFYNTAFSPEQQNIINFTALDNSAYDSNYSAYDSASTSDRIYLLSWDDMLNDNYGFGTINEKSTLRVSNGTDYALSQGLEIPAYNNDSGNSNWILRSAGYIPQVSCYVGFGGDLRNYCYTYFTSYGVRPALNLNLKSDIIQCKASETAASTACSVGDKVYFGSYPQTEVTDESLVSALNDVEGEWVSYGYYSGTGTKDDGQMVASDYMRYTDVTYNGNKYRGVTFDTYRPYYTGYGISSDDSYQDENGYTTGNVYWFKYEPIKWRVLDPDSGLVMCDTIIDSQPYNNYLIYDSSVSNSQYAYFGNESKTYYASDYANSSIRQWLNEDFYNTAFSDEQKSNIPTTELNNDGYYTLVGRTGYEALDSASTNDKVFLLSYDEALNSNYGFSASKSTGDSARQIKESDYAKSQGLSVNYNGFSDWSLRTPGWRSNYSCYVKYSGAIYDDGSTNVAPRGVVPAIKIQNLPHEHSFTNYVSDGNATCTKDGTKTAKCDRCDVTDTIADEGSMLEHSFTNYVSNNNATCTEDGTKTAKCDNCDETDTVTDEGSAKGHNFVDVEYNDDATCTNDGTKIVMCSNEGCEEWKKVTNEGSAKGHKLVDHDAKAPTCTEIGWDAYQTCENCDYTTYSEVKATGHSFTNYVSNNNSTCTEEGTKTAKCDNCDETDTVADEGSAKGHSIGPVEETVTKPATCTQEGTVRCEAKCTECGELIYSYTGFIPATGHTEADAVKENEKAATCTEDGSYDEVVYCATCGEELSREEKTAPATGHADENEDGKCDVCGIVTDEDLANPCRNAEIYVGGKRTVDYHTNVTIKATAENVPEGYFLVMTVNGEEIKGTNTEVTCEYGEIEEDINYTVKVVDEDGNTQVDDEGTALEKEGGTITCKAGIAQKLIAFIKKIFGFKSATTIEPNKATDSNTWGC